MTDRRRLPTIKDVAAAAGVSPSTVSHTFSGRRAISSQTKKRVLEVAETLGYHPNPHAKSMRTGKSGMVGLLLRPRVSKDGSLESHETFNRLTGAIAVECIREGMGLVHIPSLDDARRLAFPMDGCILAHPHAEDSGIDTLVDRGIPVVCADPDPARPDVVAHVGVDYTAGVRQLVDTFQVSAGDEVWLMVGSEDNAWKVSSERAVREWAQREQLDLRVHRAQGYMRPSQAHDALSELLRKHRPPQGIIFSRSDLTEPIVAAVERTDLSIPDDVQAAALTDSAHTRIPLRALTALDLNQEALAQAAVAQLLRVLDTPNVQPEPTLVSPRLHVRASTLKQQSSAR